MSQWRGEEGSQALLGASADSQVAVPSGARESETWELNSVRFFQTASSQTHFSLSVQQPGKGPNFNYN